ncbi:MAG: c-type cytochrome [Chloroflexota bacterium]
MNKFSLTGLIALVLLVTILPLYALMEPARMEQAQTHLRQQFVSDGAVMYVENCLLCHGVAGEGVGAMPGLDNPELVATDFEAVYRTIAQSPHGSTMGAWHIDRGGLLNDYQIRVLVTLIQQGAWHKVRETAVQMGVALSPSPAPLVEIEALEAQGEADPHECRACHEEPAVHASRFGLNCARCHTLVSWRPALLTRHVFDLEHGGTGQIPCQTCHTESYSFNTCYGCHDHDPEQVVASHAEEGITMAEIEPCDRCHPTGAAGEGGQLRDNPPQNPKEQTNHNMALKVDWDNQGH